MAWTETFSCNVCGKEKSETTDDWWLVWEEQTSPTGDNVQPMLRVTHWNFLLSHDATARHLCGARCTQTLLDRWMHATNQPGIEEEEANRGA
jgi:hypothetical protein